MANETARREPQHPTHSWGFLAKDPLMRIGPKTEAYREVLRRYWRRNGGDDELFERLIPPVGAEKKRPG